MKIPRQSSDSIAAFLKLCLAILSNRMGVADFLSSKPGAGMESTVDRPFATLLVLFLAFTLHAAIGLEILAGDSQAFDFLLYASLSVLVPPIVALVFLATDGGTTRQRDYRAALTGSACLVVSAVSLVFILLSLVLWSFGAASEAWKPAVFVPLACICLVHCAFLLLLGAGLVLRRDLPATGVGNFCPGVFASLGLALLALLMAVHLDGRLPLLGTISEMFAGLTPRPKAGIYVLAIVVGLAVVPVAMVLLRHAANLSDARRQQQERIALIACIVAIFGVWFDLRFNTDVLHFMTNAGPANQMLHTGAIPMVDAYSQYGLGPMLMTWLAFVMLEPNLHAANVMAQLHSMVLYGCVLTCMYRATPHKLAALWLGFFAVGVLLSGWWYGNYSLNSVPSSMGLRYLPCALVALSISQLNKSQPTSLPLNLSMMLCALWSTEILFAGAAIIGLFLCLEFARQLRLHLLVRPILLSLVLPVGQAVMLIHALTYLAGGAAPDFQPLIDFLKVYNMTSEFWSIAASGQFFGWIAVAATAGLTLSCVWYLALREGIAGVSDPQDSAALVARRWAPLAGLVVIMSSYFVGRSVDFTLIIAFLPFAALVIPAFLELIAHSDPANRARMCLTAALGAIIALSVAFSVLATFRAGGPYRPLLATLMSGDLAKVGSHFNLRPMLDQEANPNFFDTAGLAQDALRAIEAFAPEQKHLALLLGQHPATPWSVHTDLVLLLAGTGHRWPISYVLSDELSHTRTKRILEKRPTLKAGEVVILRRDKTFLGPLEAGILRNVQNGYTLCRQEFASELIDVFTIAAQGGCSEQVAD